MLGVDQVRFVHVGFEKKVRFAHWWCFSFRCYSCNTDILTLEKRITFYVCAP
jgi:hypothetical protein